MLWAIALIFVILILLTIRSMVYYKKYNLPGPYPLPVIGNMHKFSSDPAVTYLQALRLCDEYKEDGLFALWIGTHLVTIVTKVEYIEKILSSTTLITKSMEYQFFKEFLGDGVLISSGSKWHTRRKFLTSAFHFKILENFAPIFNKHSSNLVNVLRDKTKQTFNIAPLIQLTALDLLCETAMGIDLKGLDNFDSEYILAAQRISTLLIKRIRHLWLWPDFIFNNSPYGVEYKKCLDILHNFTRKVINERREARNNSKINADEQNGKFALLDLLLNAESAGEISEQDIKEEIDTFMFEGHDSPSSALFWIIYLIAMHNDVQEKIFAEIMEVLGESLVDVKFSDVSKLKYLECVIKETLRLYSILPNVTRKVTEPLKINGYELPIGSTVGIFTNLVQRDPKYYNDPNNFHPERWLTDQPSNRSPYAFLPFSAGTRNCIGQKFAMMEMKIILTWLVRSYKISTHIKEENLVPSLEGVLKPKNGVFVYLEERQ